MRILGHECGALTTGMSILISKDTRACFLACSLPCEDPARTCSLQTRKWGLTRHRCASTLEASKTVRNKCLLSKLPSTQYICYSMLSWLRLTIGQALYHVLREGNGTPLQYSCLENPMDGGAWWAAVHRVAKSRTWLSDFTFTFHFHALEKEMATHSSVLAWRIPGTGEPGGLPSLRSHKVGNDWSDLAAAAAAAVPCTRQGGDTAVSTGRAVLIIYSWCLFWLVSHCSI